MNHRFRWRLQGMYVLPYTVALLPVRRCRVICGTANCVFYSLVNNHPVSPRHDRLAAKHVIDTTLVGSGIAHGLFHEC